VTAVVGGACAESIATALPNTRTAVAEWEHTRTAELAIVTGEMCSACVMAVVNDGGVEN
jgi:hypothetical protein